jgi:hypothetical protein
MKPVSIDDRLLGLPLPAGLDKARVTGVPRGHEQEGSVTLPRSPSHCPGRMRPSLVLGGLLRPILPGGSNQRTVHRILRGSG